MMVFSDVGYNIAFGLMHWLHKLSIIILFEFYYKDMLCAFMYEIIFYLFSI